jgi:hypothetical protein
MEDGRRIKGWPYLWGPRDAAAVEESLAVEVDEVEGSRTSLSPADFRSAMPRRPTPSGRQRAGAGAAGWSWSWFLSGVERAMGSG